MGVVIVEREPKIADSVVEQTPIAIVATEHVAGKENALLFQEATLGIGPVQERGVKER